MQNNITTLAEFEAELKKRTDEYLKKGESRFTSEEYAHQDLREVIGGELHNKFMDEWSAIEAKKYDDWCKENGIEPHQ